MRVRARPTVYEINTAVWLRRLGRDLGRPLGLDEVPGCEWDVLAALPVDAVWLMGVWRRSPAGRAVAVAEPGLLAGYRAALPDVREDDVLGSPYCVSGYVVDERFGGPDGLARAREQLADRGVGLILDFVPNHIALDHPWVTDRPQYLLNGCEEELALHPDAFVRIGGRVFAKARDPYFAPWQDVLQLNAFSPALRDAAGETLIAIGDQCDGLRCDMAMLMTNEVFARTWGDRAGPSPEADYWPTVIGRCKQAHPDLMFIAEVYWDMEWTLQQQGFELCYDKRLYDRLVHDSPASVRGHLHADAGYQEHLIRFIENHDEPRGGGHLRGRTSARRRRRDVHTAGCAPLPRRPAGRSSHTRPGPARTRAGGAAGQRSTHLLRASVARDSRLAVTNRTLASVRMRTLVRPRRHSPTSRCLVLGELGRAASGRGQPVAGASRGPHTPAVG